MAQVHELKIEPQWLRRVKSGEKTAELRFNDRDYQCGDTLRLEAFNPQTQTYMGHSVRARVTHVLHSVPGLQDGWVILSITKVGDQ